MGQTTTFQLPYPEPTDPADVPIDVKELAERLEVVLGTLQTQLTNVAPGKPEPGDMKVVGYPVSAGGEPSGWLLCDGRTVSRATYAALFAKLGTAHGVGDGSTTFNLPDQRGRTLMGAGTGPGLTARALGARGGEETHVVSVGEMPSHNHGGKTSAGVTGTGTTGGGTTGGGTTGGGTTGGGTAGYTNIDHDHWLTWNRVTTGNFAGSPGNNVVTGINDWGAAGYTSSRSSPATQGNQNHSHSIPGLSIPGLSVPGLSVPGLSVPALSVPQLDITAQGGGGGMTIVQPFVTVNVLIKT